MFLEIGVLEIVFLTLTTLLSIPGVIGIGIWVNEYVHQRRDRMYGLPRYPSQAAAERSQWIEHQRETLGVED